MKEIRQVDGQLVRKVIFMDDDISNAGINKRQYSLLDFK